MINRFKLKGEIMIISRTPFRMSFFGGGTDIEEFFNEYGGVVLSTTFDKYCYVNVRHLPRFFDYRNQVTYSKIERVLDENDIEHPAVRNAMKMLDMHELIVTYDADLPARTGLGTSSSFAVGLINAFYALKGEYVDKKHLSDSAIYLERVLCNEAGGWQDQIAAAYGGLNIIEFKNKDYLVRPIIIDSNRKNKLNENLLLFFTGFSRNSVDIQTETKKNINEKIQELLELKSLAYKAEKILEDNNYNLDEFGYLLDYSWRIKRQIGSRISTSLIDDMYDKAIKAGALGGKLLGAGGGGFLLFYVQKDMQGRVRHALKDLLEIPFKFEDIGSQIIYFNYESYSPVNQ